MPISRGTHLLYTVRPGDSLYTIAEQLGTNVPSLVQINSLYPPFAEPDRIFPGQVLLARLPGMAEESSVWSFPFLPRPISSGSSLCRERGLPQDNNYRVVPVHLKRRSIIKFETRWGVLLHKNGLQRLQKALQHSDDSTYNFHLIKPPLPKTAY